MAADASTTTPAAPETLMKSIMSHTGVFIAGAVVGYLICHLMTKK